MNSIPVFVATVVDPVITIAIPTFKRSALLFEAINSAINQQTSLCYEILVLDNNPDRDDETEILMQQFAGNSLISYYKNSSNLGMVGNWNQLYSLSKGTWVSMLHDDDLLYPNYIEIIYKRLLCLEDPDVIFPSYQASRDRHINSRDKIQSSWSYTAINTKSFILGNIVGPPVGMLVRKQFFLDCLLFHTTFYPSIDWDFYIDASRIGKLYRLSDILCLYYIGVNESLKEQTIMGFYKNAQDLNNKLFGLLRFPYNVLNKLCYRNLIVNTIKWTATIADRDTLSKAIGSIGYKRNGLLEWISQKIAKVFSVINHHSTTIKL